MYVGEMNKGGGKEVREEEKQENKEQVEVKQGLEVQGLPGGLDAVAVDACADGVEAEGDASSS